MNRSTDAEAARFGFEAGRIAGWHDAANAAAIHLIEQGQPVTVTAALIRKLRTAP